MKKSDKKILLATLSALAAACFYAVNVPLSKLLLDGISPTFAAAFLYLGAGVGVGIMYLFRLPTEEKSERLTKSDLPYTVAMIVLDILAPILLMYGVKIGRAANASLLGNFEIVATAAVAFAFFREKVSGRLWTAVGLITLSSIILSFEGSEGFEFSVGSLFVILATVCWGVENNCTRKISGKSTYEIVTFKGLFSGGGAFCTALVMGEKLSDVKLLLLTMLLGFVAYGLSIFLYIRAQRDLGAAKTGAYYAVAPFVGMLLAFLLCGDKLSVYYGVALAIMTVGAALAVSDSFG